MQKRLKSLFSIIFLLSNLFTQLGSTNAYAAENLDASQFVTSVALADANGPIGTNRIRDTSSVQVTYNLNLGNGSAITTDQPYTMSLPKELNYTTTTPISINTPTGVHLADVTISNGIISIQFTSDAQSYDNLRINFNFWATFNRSQLNYETGNDLAFPTQTNPNNTVHLNFSKSSSGGGSGTSAIAKSLSYEDTDPTIINWTLTVNNGGYPVENASLQDIMENNQDYIPGSMTIIHRNWRRAPLTTEHTEPVITQQADGTQTFNLSFGKLTSSQEQNNAATTSLVIHYQTRLLYNSANNRYPNTVSTYDNGSFIDTAVSTATYHGQGGGGEGDQLITISGTKIWEDEENGSQTRPETISVSLLRDGVNYRQTTISESQDGKRPDRITVNLLANGAFQESQTVTSQNDWHYQFTNLPKFLNGREIEYSVSENAVPDYVTTIEGNTITNTHTPEVRAINVQKVWDDQNDQDGLRPEAVTLTLLANGEKIDEASVSGADQWAHTWEGLPKNDKGQAINYTIEEETAVPGYTSTVSKQNDDSFIVTNTHSPEQTSVKGHKNWQDNNDRDKKRPNSITVLLLANGEQVATKQVTANDNWDYEFTDLPKNSNGQPIVYTINEEPVSGYTSQVEGFNLTNTYKEVPTIPSVNVTQQWDDDNDREKDRPSSVKVQLYDRDKKHGDPVILNDGNHWSHSWKNLPKQDANGNKTNYTVKAIDVPKNYQSTVVEQAPFDFVIVNTHINNTNKAAKAYPNTGEKSSTVITILGMTFLLGVLLVHLHRRFFIKDDR
ncbi:Cna B-type domain-containing protein [Enterococcus avium]|uniref:Cna B-type domain-containing protein n=1 Tax=Enterococcus avium TaxID=33945 RepID=UPI0025AFE152|nr:Cna B-type domain-containing protein [Enterococcus avium]MDN2636833.1 Cna B-type domain-containing protein [Enterococcus avium]